MSIMSTVSAVCAAALVGSATVIASGVGADVDAGANLAVDSEAAVSLSKDNGLDVTVTADGTYEIDVTGAATVVVAIDDETDVRLVSVETKAGWNHDSEETKGEIKLVLVNPNANVMLNIVITVDANGTLDVHIERLENAHLDAKAGASVKTDASASATGSATTETSTSSGANSESADTTVDAKTGVSADVRTHSAVESDTGDADSNGTSAGGTLGLDVDLSVSAGGSVDVSKTSDKGALAGDCVTGTLLAVSC